MKKLFLTILAVIILILSSCRQGFVEYPYEEKFEDWSLLEPVITDFDGELFGDRNVTADGLYTGCEKLGAFGDILHCNDNGLTIWFDKNNGGFYRLNYSGQKEKICPDEKCRNDINGECFHMRIFNYIYSDGFLYFTYGGTDTVDVEVEYWYNKTQTRKKAISKGVFIYRYDIDANKLEKLIGFQGITECELTLNGRYLYALTYTWEASAVTNSGYKADFVITRIDLLDENAVIVYSDMSNRDDFSKICDPKDFRFINDKIAMPVNDIANFEKRKGSINICNMEMQNIKTLIEFAGETVSNLYLYDNDIYFMSDKGLCRVSIEMYSKYVKEAVVNPQNNEKTAILPANKREILNKNITSFCIDGDFLYYTVNLESNLYRIKLDYSRELNFNNTFAVYIPGQGENFSHWDWKVCGGYLYTILNTEKAAWRCRIKLNSESKPYLFYEEYQNQIYDQEE